MSIAEDLKPKLENNQRVIFITDADDLLAAWRHRRMNKFKRSFDFSRVPTECRLSAPPDQNAACMPCHVTLNRTRTGVIDAIRPAYEHSSIACHNYGRMKTVTPKDLEKMDTLNGVDAVSFARRNMAPYVSPVLDTITLARVCKDLGIDGRAIPKIIKGRQCIAFTGYAGLRSLFPGTAYSHNNRKIIRMAIGSLGIKNMVKNGGTLTFIITVPLTILECYLRDPHSLSEFAGNLTAEILKIGIGMIMGTIAGLIVGTWTTIAIWPIVAAIAIGAITTYVLNEIDEKYQLTEKLVIALEYMADEANKAVDTATWTLSDAFWNFLRQNGIRYHIYPTIFQ